MKRALPLLILVACSGKSQGTDKGPPPPDSGTTTGAVTGTPGGTTTSLPTGRIEESGVITCADPTARDTQVYTPTAYGDAWPKNPDYRTPAWTLATGGRGTVVHDFDGDGALDILVPRDLFPAVYLHGDGDGTFTEDNSVFGGVDVMGHNGGSAGDYDGDGDPDVILYGLMGDATMLVNEGGSFSVVDRSEWDIGTAPFGCGGGAAWADYDRDGDLDLFYGRLGGTDPYTMQEFQCDSRLLNNDGTGVFTADDGQLSADLQSIRVMVAGFYDFDNNGWLDLYAVSDAPPMRNYLLYNDGGTFSQPLPTGLEVVTAGMGLGVGDLNGDGRPDATVSGIRELPTLLSQGELGVWVESSTAMALQPDTQGGRTIAWGGDLADLDNDGHLDAVFTYGGVFGNALAKAQPDDLYRNLGDGTFEHVGDDWNFNELDVGRGAITVDVNGDGWLDIVKRELGGLVTVSTAACGSAAWLEVRLHDDANPNQDAIGAIVHVYVGETEYIRTITAGSRSYCSGGPPVAHFGLGDVDAIDRIEVLWPAGERVVYPGVASRQIVDLWPTE